MTQILHNLKSLAGSAAEVEDVSEDRRILRTLGLMTDYFTLDFSSNIYTCKVSVAPTEHNNKELPSVVCKTPPLTSTSRC